MKVLFNLVISGSVYNTASLKCVVRTKWTVRPAQPHITPLCLPSLRHQVMSFSWQYSKPYLWTNTNRKCVSKRNFTHLLFNNPIGPREINIINRPNFSGLRQFFSISFLLSSSWLFRWSISHVYFYWHELHCPWHNSLKRNDRNKGSF